MRKKQIRTKYDKKADQIAQWEKKHIRKWKLIMLPIMLVTVAAIIIPFIINPELWWMSLIGMAAFSIEEGIFDRNIKGIRNWTRRQMYTIEQKQIVDELDKMK